MARFHTLVACVALVSAIACGSGSPGTTIAGPVARHSSSIALSADESTLFVVNPMSDSIAFIDVSSRKLVREVALGSAPPSVDAKGHYWVSVEPRALAESPSRRRIYVAGRRSGAVHVVDESSGAVLSTIAVGAEPAGILVSPDERSIFVACSNEGEVVRIDADALAVDKRVSVASKPWGLAWSNDGKSLFVSHLLGPGLTVVEPSALAVQSTWAIADGAPHDDSRVAHGPSRGLYDVVARPGSSEVWVAHVMLGIDTAQPALNFQNTVFPAVSVLKADGTQAARMSVQPQDLPGEPGAFGDVVSGPHALAFTPDGAYALMVDSASEDVLAIDASGRVEATLLRPLPGHMPDGIAMSKNGSVAYVFERNSNDVVFVHVSETPRLSLAVDGAAISTVHSDPMPPDMRKGEHVFYSANSDEMPISTDHWVACASCHIEGRSDAVTWRFKEGPRDTPSNAGGVLETGFLLHTAARKSIVDYWQTINDEQGGHFSINDPALLGQLKSLESFVNHALPLPAPPRTDPAKVARGQVLFNRTDVGCGSCHSGPALTDSGALNPTLDLSGPITLHDVGTCVADGGFPDAAHKDVAGNARKPCLFDTPTLRGVSESAPYFHDGSAPTLRDALVKTKGKMGDISKLSDADLDDLVEYLRSL